MPVNPGKQRIRDQRNKEIYEMYTSESKPKSYAEIARIMTHRGEPITPAGVGKIVHKMEEKIQESKVTS